jgi:hypothetical protein
MSVNNEAQRIIMDGEIDSIYGNMDEHMNDTELGTHTWWILKFKATTERLTKLSKSLNAKVTLEGKEALKKRIHSELYHLHQLENQLKYLKDR